MVGRSESSVAATVPLVRLLAQPKNSSGAIGLRQPWIAVALVSFAGRLRSGVMANRGD
jgi:hypothetical protein